MYLFMSLLVTLAATQGSEEPPATLAVLPPGPCDEGPTVEPSPSSATPHRSHPMVSMSLSSPPTLTHMVLTNASTTMAEIRKWREVGTSSSLVK